MPLDNSKERVRFVRPESFPGVELLIVTGSTKKWSSFHDTYSLCVCENAAHTVRYGGKEHAIVDGGALLMEPGETHYTTEVHKPTDLKVLMMSPRIVTDAARELELSTTPHLRVANSDRPGLMATLYGFCAAVETGASLLEQQSRFAACVRKFLEHTEYGLPPTRSQNETAAIARIKKYLQERFADQISLADLATLAGISKFHLVRAFAKKVGVPPHLYQINIRIAKSRILLRAGVPPKQIATDLGFADQSHFIRHFKRVWGITPSRYANAR